MEKIALPFVNINKLLINKSNYIVILLSIFLIFQISTLIVDIFNIEEHPVNKANTLAKVVEPEEQTERTTLQSVANNHLFGQVIKKPEKQKILAAPETKKPLTLLGVFYSEQDETSIAIIQEKQTQAEMVKQGDSLSNGTKVIAIYTDRAVLSDNGKMETLKLKREKAKIQVVMEGNVVTEKKSNDIKSVVSLYLNKPEQFWKRARVTKTKVAKQKFGYMLSYSDRRLMRNLNIYPRDIILSVNDISVTNTQKIKKLVKDLNKTQTLTLNLLRNGQNKEVVVNLK